MTAVVFAGPSLAGSPACAEHPLVSFAPPVRRGDLQQLADSDRPPTHVLVIDGEFGQSLSVSVTEVRRLIRQGVAVLGAASMGALRAAECWPIGMRGYGWIYGCYRAGLLDSDDEVALTFDPLRLTAVTVPLVNVRWAARLACRRGDIGPDDADAVVATARRIGFRERTWDDVVRDVAGCDRDLGRRLRHFLADTPSERLDRKRLDAELAVRALQRTTRRHATRAKAVS